MTWTRWAVALSGWVALAVTQLPETSPLRRAIVVLFLLLCPGLAATLLWGREVFVRGAGPARLLEGAVLVVGGSLSLTALAAEALFLSNAFTLTRALLVLAALSSLLVLASALRGRLHHEHRALASED
ncbi:hypothetical protein [Streptomyces dubilierae]|uniref:DUF1616 domain-containing protein n=1 Tax=Streptomyces dubilierae TaxID=3075533 RepID=A0ABU2PH96_9ACTN|nr:hypothetical protein [Streptomyces sp. DSM 41921]MDT0391528.1 hypothetical protein [Streptomyces sp. DSM 41921]